MRFPGPLPWLLLVLPACLGSGDAPEMRYFRPVAVAESSPAAARAPAGWPMHLDPVTAAGHVGEEVAWQADGVEYGFYRDRSWTESPAHFVEEALRVELYERQGFALPLDAKFAKLTVEVIAFEEVRVPRHEARVALRAVLRHADGDPARMRRFESAQPLQDEDPAALARGVGVAMHQVIDDLAVWLRSDPP